MPQNAGLYRYIGYTKYCPLKSNNIGYWTPKFGRVTEYRSSKNGQYSTATGLWLHLSPLTVENWPFFWSYIPSQDLLSVSNIQYMNTTP